MKNPQVATLTAKNIKYLVCLTFFALFSFSPALANTAKHSQSPKVNTGLSGGGIVPRHEEYRRAPAPYPINRTVPGGGGGGCGGRLTCPQPGVF